MTPLILAIPDLDSEPDLVSSAALHGVVVARRSFDAADLLAAAAADTSMAVALSAGIPRLSGDHGSDCPGHWIGRFRNAFNGFQPS